MVRLLLSLLFVGCHAVVAEPGLPIRGWSSWTQFRCHVNETLVLQMGRAIVDSAWFPDGPGAGSSLAAFVVDSAGDEQAMSWR